MNQSTVGAIINRPQKSKTMKNVCQTKNQGITLIALVVTIIVLLILAGITIGLISGSDGILGRATVAVDKNNIETAKEQVTLKVGEYQEDFYERKYVTYEIDNAYEAGDWIYENHENQALKVKDYEFTITLPEGLEKADKEHPYIVTIKKNRRLPREVKGTLSVDGILEWDTNFIADADMEETEENIVSKWLSYIENDESYEFKNIEDVFQNEILIQKLLYSEDAVNYLLSNDMLMTKIINSENGMKELAKSEYAGYRAITSDTWKSSILNSPYISIFDEYSTQVGKLSNNTNTLKTSVYTSSYYGSGAFEPFHVFDKNSNTSWCSKAGDTNGYIGYDFRKNVVVYKVSLLNCASNNYWATENFLTGKLQYFSDDKQEWIDASEVQTFEIQYTSYQNFYSTTNGIASKWILRGLSSKGAYLHCRELQFYARVVPEGVSH